MQTSIDVPGVKLEQVASARDETTFSVVVDGNDVGTVAFVKHYEPAAEAFDGHVALWAGPTLCVIDRQHGTMRCIDRDDETHRIHPFESKWIVEGELNVDLFDPESGVTLATYRHEEVITKGSVAHGLVHIEDFAGATVTLDPGRSLQVVGRGSSSESDARRSSGRASSDEAMSEQHDRPREQLVKMAINLSASYWHTHVLETVWAEPLGGDRYRLQNVPFYAYGLSIGDVVNAKEIGGQLLVQNTVERGGHSTYRVFLSRDVKRDGGRFQESWRPLQEIGVTYEQANDRLLAIDVPDSTDLYRAYVFLQRGEEAGVWDFEEAHCGHPLSR